MNHVCKRAGIVCLSVALGACSSMTTIQSAQPDTRVIVGEQTATRLPAQMEFSDTTFGSYEFKATESGHAPLYGLLPLNVQGGNLTMDILFFMPAIWFNLRGVYAMYQFDVADRVVRYKDDEDDAWHAYHPTSHDIAQARKHFGDAHTPASRTASAPATPHASTQRSGATASGNTHSDAAVCDTRRTGIICPDDPTRHTH